MPNLGVMQKIQSLYDDIQRFLTSGTPSSTKRLLLVFRFTQISIILALISMLYFTTPQSLGSYISVCVILSASIAFIEYITRLLKNGSKRKSVNLFLGLLLLLLPYVIWFEGGVLSPAITLLPVLIMFAALYATFFDFIITVSLLTIAVLFVCLNSFYGWLPSNSVQELNGLPRLISVLIVATASIFTTWAIGSDLHAALEEIDEDHKKVQKSHNKAQQLSDFDLLTGLHNRQSSKNLYYKMLSSLEKSSQRIVFFFIDLDSFKSINDLFDHSAGDEVLITMADRIQHAVPEGSIVGRMGSDKFTVFLKAHKDFNEEVLAKKILKKLSETHDLLGSPAAITASIGIASSTSDNFNLLLKKAEMAMYQIKNKVHNSFYHYSAELEETYMKNTIILDQLKDGIEQDLFELHYQPKIDIKTNKTIGVEALIRWVKDNPNSYGPGEFMPAIEKTRLVHDIGYWVITEACKTGKYWHDLGHQLTMSVNVSSKQLTDEGFANQVKDILESSAFPAEHLQIELTEQFLINENDQVNNQLESLKELGVSLAIDDFGTGYSNIGYLTRLNVDSLKIDQSFVRQLSDPDGIRSIIKAITKTAKVMGMNVIVEGVETDYEMEQVAELGCDIGQGYLWSKPKTANQLLDQLSASRQSSSDSQLLSYEGG